MVFAESGGIQLVAVQQDVPADGFIAAMIQARATNPEYEIVTIGNLSISNLHHVWQDFALENPRSGAAPVAGPAFPEQWVAHDSHLMMSAEMVGGGGGGGFDGITESNDGTTTAAAGLPDGQGPDDAPIPAHSGYGDIAMAKRNGWFFLLPAHRGNTLDLAYVVVEEGHDLQIPVELTVGLLGSQGPPDTEFFAQFGYDSPITVPVSIPEPTGATMAFGFAALAIGMMRAKRSA